MQSKSLLIVLLMLFVPGLLAAEPAGKGDDVIGPYYGFTSPDSGFDDREVIYGLSYAHWLEDEWSVEADLGRPRETPDFLASVVGAYHASIFFFPMGVGYSEIEDDWSLQGGAGINLWAGKFNFQVQARYLASLSRNQEDDGTWSTQGALRIKF